MSTLRDQILSSAPALVPVECPEWGCTVFVSRVSGVDTRAVRAMPDGYDDADLVALIARDADGRLIFEPGDAGQLREKEQIPTARIATKFLDVNGWGTGPKNS